MKGNHMNKKPLLGIKIFMAMKSHHNRPYHDSFHHDQPNYDCRNHNRSNNLFYKHDST